MNKPSLSGKYQVNASIDINAPIDKAWKVLRDFTDVTWAPGVKASHAIGKNEMGIGAGRHCTLDGFGEIDEYITTWSEGEGFVYSVTPLGPLHNASSRWWLSQTTNNRCKLDVVFSYDLRFSFLGQLMHALIMRKKLETSLPQTVAAVKTRVEAGVINADMGEPQLTT
ncbi:MAG: SRPBCC family protein [Pseudomonadales bacterium]|nr:SRPBCC family protein [Pseudomonadales bacterium]